MLKCSVFIVICFFFTRDLLRNKTWKPLYWSF